MQRLNLGRVLRAHGLRGEVRIRPYHRESEVLGQAEILYLGERTVRILRARSAPAGEWIVLLEGVSDRSAAEALAGTEVFVERGSLPEVEEGHYLADLLGLRVVDTRGTALGVVAEVQEAGPQDLLVIRQDAREWLLPAVDALIVSVDAEAGVLVVDPPEGLVDLGET